MYTTIVVVWSSLLDSQTIGSILMDGAEYYPLKPLLPGSSCLEGLAHYAGHHSRFGVLAFPLMLFFHIWEYLCAVCPSLDGYWWLDAICSLFHLAYGVCFGHFHVESHVHNVASRLNRLPQWEGLWGGMLCQGPVYHVYPWILSGWSQVWCLDLSLASGFPVLSRHLWPLFTPPVL